MKIISIDTVVLKLVVSSALMLGALVIVFFAFVNALDKTSAEIMTNIVLTAVSLVMLFIARVLLGDDD